MSRVLSAMSTNARTENGALSNSTTGFAQGGSCLDYFFKCGNHNLREQSVVNADMSSIFGDDSSLALKILFGLRLITRKPEGLTEIQTGMGKRDEFYKGIVWLHNNKPELLYNNLHLIPVFGSWKDFLNDPLLESLDRARVYRLFSENLSDQLLLKYLPQIRSKSKVRSNRDNRRSEWAKGFVNFLGITQRQYRKLKSKGAAHVWQKQMSAQNWDKINFNGIPGKAMMNHISRTGKDQQSVFERHGQIERLQEWVASQNLIKFTGYPYELTQRILKSRSNTQNLIYDKQFQQCLKSFEGHNLGNVLCAIDTSASMTWTEENGVTPLDICLSLGVSFSHLNVGYFKDVVCAFNSISTLAKLNGSLVEKTQQIALVGAGGNTNFQSVIDLLVQTRQNNPDIPVEEYPETLLVVSDMQFDPSGRSCWYGKKEETNYETLMNKLESVGLGKMRVIWWNVAGRTKDFPSKMDDKGVYMVGGYDPNILKALMGLSKDKKDFKASEKTEETPYDGMINFLSQPIFDLLTI